MAKRRPKTDAGTRSETADWIRNAADEKAFAAGMRFDPERANFVCDWIETYCRLYEGDRAGEPLKLLPFQRDYFSRLYGWVRWSEEWIEWIRRFTHASFWASKKNGKSPLAAAHNLYLLCGDGEPGQKVYQAAANGQQAKIAQLHAVNMVRQSPALSADHGGDCKINNVTLQITHVPTSSVLVILTGDDSRNAKAKEGLNGSVTYDEMHVVNREIEERTSRAGISRKEPINASFSTAGDDLTSVGKQRFEYGRQVNAGDREDPHFLHVDYSAPDGITEADIEVRLEEFGRMANPAWGEIVKPSEFKADWVRSKGSQREVARFLQYRLNRWVGSTNRWLDKGSWDRSEEKYSLEDLAGRECYSALDLSRTRDLTAFVLAFPFPEWGAECLRLWPMYWMPEETAKERDHLFPFLTWAASGWITLTPGGVVDYARVKSDIRAAILGFDLQVLDLFYDQHLANEVTQALHEGEQLGTESFAGVVAQRTVFKQDIMTFSPHAKEFERRVKSGAIRHPGNSVMSWQVGHCEVKTDPNQNIRPVKPAPHSGKSVDGVVCGVMTMAGILSGSAGSGFINPNLVAV